MKNITENILYNVSRRFLLGEAHTSLSLMHYIRSIKDLISNINRSTLSTRDSQRLDMILQNVSELEKGIKNLQRSASDDSEVIIDEG